MGYPKTVRNIEFCQQISRLKDFDKDRFKEWLLTWDSINKFAFIVHDKDKKDSGDLKDAHTHAMLHFSQPHPFEAVVKRFRDFFGEQVTEQCFEKCKKWSSAIAYLTHENRLDKHQYDRSEVVANYDFNEDADDGARANGDARLQELLGLIDSEELRQYNVTDHMSIMEYQKYKRQINDGFEYVYTRKAKESNRSMDVMYISGKARTGKTTFAKWFCEQNHYSYAVSSSSNDPMQDYKGQDALILDDFRPGEWKMTDLLKLLDNHTNSSVKSRYSNKYMCYCKCVILTSVVPLSRVWDFLKEKDEKEPIEQLYGRVTMECTIEDDGVNMRVGDKELMIKNPVVQYLKDKEKEQLRVTAQLTAMGFTEKEEWLNDVENVRQIELEFSKNDSSTDFNVRLKHDQAVYKAQQKSVLPKPVRKTKAPKKAN